MRCEHGEEMGDDYVPGQIHAHVKIDEETGESRIVDYVDAEFVGGPLDGSHHPVPLDGGCPARRLKVRFVAPRPPLPEEIEAVEVPYRLIGDHEGHPVYSF